MAGIVAFAALAPAATGGYTIRPGDTLSAIAGQHGVSVAALAEANGIDDPDRIYAGRRLTIPGEAQAGGGAASAPTGVHVVGSGDTLSGIAQRYGISVRALADANGIGDIHLIRIGDRLSVPGTGGSGGAGASTTVDPTRLPHRLRSSPGRLQLIPVFERWAAEYGVPANLLMAMTWLESGWQNDVVSPVGAVGIGQLLPSTVDFVNTVLLQARLDARVPEDNIRMSARFLRWLLDRTAGDVEHALAAYYQGLASVRARGVYPSTAGYVRDVLAIRNRHFAA